jgi:uncharacterized Zn finger protein
MSWYGRFAPYTTVAERKQEAAGIVAKLKKKGQFVQPILLEGRFITKTFWGKAWCKHLESYSDYDNRLPRGRSYVRHGAVIDLQIAKGEITALVSGSSLYKVNIVIAQVMANKWYKIVNKCAKKIDSLIELLQGKFSNAVMEIMTDPEQGLFPHPKEIKLSCSCPDWADMCKHVAAVLYGIGVRIDEKPEELFLLRQVDPVELIAKASSTSLTKVATDQSDQIFSDDDLSSLFGIDMGDMPQKNADSTKAVSKPKRRKLSKDNKKIKLKTTRVGKAKSAKKTAKQKAAKKKLSTTMKKMDSKAKLSVKKTSSKNDPKKRLGKMQ